MVNGNGSVKPFDSFKLLYTILVWVGFSRLFDKPRSQMKFLLHQMYRPTAFLIVFIFMVQHLIFTLMTVDDAETMFEGVIIVLPSIVLLFKVYAINYGHLRLEELRELMEGPIFAPNHKKDEEYLTNNKNNINNLTKLVNIATTVTATFWAVAPFARRMQGESNPLPSYFPFETTSWKGFLGAWFLETSSVIWTGFGHINIDILIAAYYAQSSVQLQIIKHNLENICDSEAGTINIKNHKFQFKDDVDANIQHRFVHYVQRYQKVVWYTNQVNTIFNSPISIQFFMSSAATCLVIYKMSVTNVTSLPFMYLLVYFFILQTQVLLFCYYGGLVNYESLSVADSVYLGDWVSLSPRFRRQLAIAMACWSRPIEPRVSFIIPLSLSTFVKIVQAAYKLFTFLKSSQNL